MPGCPFYGHRWPERSPTLHIIGGNECGLDLDGHGPCRMESQGRNVDYFACPVALDRHPLLSAARNVIQFKTDTGTLVFLAEWEETAKG